MYSSPAYFSVIRTGISDKPFWRRHAGCNFGCLTNGIHLSLYIFWSMPCHLVVSWVRKYGHLRGFTRGLGWRSGYSPLTYFPAHMMYCDQWLHVFLCNVTIHVSSYDGQRMYGISKAWCIAWVWILQVKQETEINLTEFPHGIYKQCKYIWTTTKSTHPIHSLSERHSRIYFLLKKFCMVVEWNIPLPQSYSKSQNSAKPRNSAAACPTLRA